MIKRFFSCVFMTYGCLLVPASLSAQERTVFPVGASTKTAGYTPLWAGVTQGFFAKQGLEVQPVVIRGSDRAIQALAGGSVYASVLAPDAPMVAADRGLDSMIIAGNTQRLAHWILGGKNIRSYDDLRGATVGTISLTAGTGLILRHVLKAKGLEYPRDYKLLVIGGTPQLFTALTSNQIAAAPLALPYNFAAEELGYNSLGSFMDIYPNYQLTVLAGSRAWAEKNRRMMIRFLKGFVQSIRWLRDNEAAATEYMIKEFNFKRVHGKRAWQYYGGQSAWHYDGRVNLEGMKTVVQMMSAQNQGKGPQANVTDYINESYLAEALKELQEGR